MAGETIKTRAICLRISSWSLTSHVVSWLTPSGRVATVVKGAVRPKSWFLGQYDLGYTCDIVYYAHGRGETRALRDAYPVAMREALRDNLAALTLAERFRYLAETLAPNGPDAAEWFSLLDNSLNRIEDFVLVSSFPSTDVRTYPLALLLDYEIKALRLTGLHPDIGEDGGTFALSGERRFAVSAAAARCLANPFSCRDAATLLDAARALGIFYKFHLDCAMEGRRQTIQLISKT